MSCPSRIQRQDLKPQSLKHESSPITTRPGLPPIHSNVAGTQFGTVVALLLSGVLADEFGWEWIFYFFGILGCVWCVVWIWICYDSPDKHPRISKVVHYFKLEIRTTPSLSFHLLRLTYLQLTCWYIMTYKYWYTYRYLIGICVQCLIVGMQN